MDLSEYKIKAARYCAYQERAPFEVMEKLKGLGLGTKQILKVMAELYEDGYVNESRFAGVFAKGKFRNNKWGKIKIKQHLILKKVSPDIIEQGINEIPFEEYMEMINSLVIQKSKNLDEPDTYVKNNKIANYMVHKGFEPELVWNALKRLS